MNRGFIGRAHYPPAQFPRFHADPEKCNRCGRCLRTCPTHILHLPEEGPPQIQGYKGLDNACLGCNNCQAVCPEGAVTVNGGYFVSEGLYRTIYRGPVEPPNPFHSPEPPVFEEIEDRLTETERVIYKRRSNRLFKKKEVPEELIHRVIEAARYAPSSGNDRAWEFVVIRDQDLIRRFEKRCLKSIKMMSDLYLKPRSGWRRALWNLMSLWRPGDMDLRVISGMHTVVRRDTLFFGAPVVIVVLADMRGIGQVILDAGICAQNLVLAAHSLGLGTCYIGFITALNSMPDKKLLAEIGAVYPLRIATSIALGWPQGEIDDAVPREKARVVWK